LLSIKMPLGCEVWIAIAYNLNQMAVQAFFEIHGIGDTMSTLRLYGIEL